jgi:outer membrane protein W
VRIIQRFYRILFLLFIAAGASRTFAQTSPTNEAGIWISRVEFEDNDVSGFEGERVTFEFDEDTGYGISFNHYWTDRFSTELAYQTMSADISVGLEGFPDLIDTGTIDARALTAVAQIHFLRATRFSPYIGAGVARVTGDIDPTDDPELPNEGAPVDLESKLTWVANAGVNIAVTNNIAIAADAKFISWEAMENNDREGVTLDVNPLVISAGVKVRF